MVPTFLRGNPCLRYRATSIDEGNNTDDHLMKSRGVNSYLIAYFLLFNCISYIC
jgi:hypothetical protein